MLNDVALMLFSLDLNEKNGTTFRRSNWPVAEDMRGYELINPDVAIEWAQNIKRAYTDEARPLVEMLIDSGYVHVDNELY